MCGIAAVIHLLIKVQNQGLIIDNSTDISETQVGNGNSSESSDISEHDINEKLRLFIDKINKLLSRRGPNNHGILGVGNHVVQKKPFEILSQGCMEFHGHLLSMRGNFPQPAHDLYSSTGELKSSLLWNGEAFVAPFMNAPTHWENPKEHQDLTEKSDTELLFSWLLSKLMVENPTSSLNTHLESSVLNPSDIILQAMGQVEGPWAFIFYFNNTIYFGRDPRGRRSLLIGFGTLPTNENIVFLSSVPLIDQDFPVTWTEIDTRGIYSLNLSNSVLSLHSWPEEISTLTTRSHLNIEFNSSIHKLKTKEVLVSELEGLLRQSIRRRVHFRGDHSLVDESSLVSHQHAESPIAVLFSGGLDSTVIAALTSLEMPINLPIDLINVSFGNNETELGLAPDRITALQSFDDLCRIFPDRKWRLVFVNISRGELEQYTSEVSSLMYPSNTLMDISISAPLWFASRGQGTIKLSPCEERSGNFTTTDLQQYRTSAKVLLLGAGADEQFAGYGRHRVAFKRGGWTELQAELDKDIKRLWKRNLGRDDRVLSDHGREARFPFLDADVMGWISSQCLWDLVDMSLPAGEGDKQVLRLLANRLNLEIAKGLPKRAIQFGTKIVKQMPKGKGTDNFEA